MGQEWRDCIVTMIDMVGVKNRTGADGSTLMRQLHALVTREAPYLGSVAHTYVWNDSVLLLSYLDGEPSFESAIRDAERLKRKIDNLASSYAVAIKGQAFPPTPGQQNLPNPHNVTLIEASSWAMANCFIVEKALGRKCKKPWYVDSRITAKIETSQTSSSHSIKLLPEQTARKIHAFDGYLWENPGDKRKGSHGKKEYRK
jgi:hypothetical protein